MISAVDKKDIRNKPAEIAKKVKKLSPEGQAIIGAVLTGEAPTLDGDAMAQPRQTTLVPKTELGRQIVDQDWKVQQQLEAVNKVRQQIHGVLEAIPSYAAVEGAKAALKEADEKLKSDALGSKKLNDLYEQLAEDRRELNFRTDVLSGLLVTYAADHRVKSIDIEGKNRLIKLEGKIGKKLDNQTELAF